jgi:predicted nucleic acid-binding protein
MPFPRILKSDIARQLLMENVKQITVSSQVINEFINICIKKNILSLEDTFKYAEEFMEIFNFSVIKKSEVGVAMHVKRRYKYSYYDSLIIASALENNCSILYTEDMQHGQIIEDSLKIINPFESVNSE